MPMPPSLSTTLGQAATSAIDRPPRGQHLVAPAGVRADAERPAEVVEHDRDVVVAPGPGSTSSGSWGWYSQASKLSPARPERGEAVAEGGLARAGRAAGRCASGGRRGWRPRPSTWRMPRNRPPPASTWAARTSSISGAREVGEADDAGDEPVGVGGDDELGLADRAEGLRAVVAVARPALDEHGPDHARHRAGVGPQVLHHVRVRRVLPQVVVGVEDGLAGRERAHPLTLAGPLPPRPSRASASCRCCSGWRCSRRTAGRA